MVRTTADCKYANATVASGFDCDATATMAVDLYCDATATTAIGLYCDANVTKTVDFGLYCEGDDGFDFGDNLSSIALR